MSASSRTNSHPAISIVGASIAGTWQALLFTEAGWNVTLYERDGEDLPSAAAHWAGGMLAPDCEAESAEPVISRLGARSLDLWKKHYPGAEFSGSLVVAHPRDRADFDRFARMAPGYERVAGEALGAIEPALAGRFRDGLFFAREGHVEPRKALVSLHEKLKQKGVAIRFHEAAGPEALPGKVIDCRGLGAREKFSDLRGVKGEMVVVETSEIELARPVRLLHPRWPLYIVPRGGGRFMIGATTIESEQQDVSVRSALELLTAAYALHPAFAEARIVEFGAGLRPAFPDNLPRIQVSGEKIAVNGLYRHGFLLAPALAELTLNYVLHGARDNEVMRWS
ncbi:MAG TPA: FAD-dependent oxidoreductase [Xanthobacteraceae bacterium]|nr:FAD-dependent oxidoreductase [Xanthobacteraceae bacterium]